MTDNTEGSESWTVLKILRWTTGYFEKQGIDSPRVDAEVLLADLLEMERIELYANFNRPMVDDELAAYRKRIKRRAAGEPCAYIVGYREFWSITLQVDQRVLIPRPDTETLVREALDIIEEHAPQTVVDVGTGSGAVAIALGSEHPDLQIAATDADEEALDVARQNVETHGLDETISLAHGDLLDAVDDDQKPVDLIVSNPPYVAETERDDLQPDVRDFEPTDALFAGEDGLDVIRRLVPDAFDTLAPGGWLLFEIGYRQGDAARDILTDAGFQHVEVIPDYGDRDRVAKGRRPL